MILIGNRFPTGVFKIKESFSLEHGEILGYGPESRVWSSNSRLWTPDSRRLNYLVNL